MCQLHYQLQPGWLSSSARLVGLYFESRLTFQCGQTLPKWKLFDSFLYTILYWLQIVYFPVILCLEIFRFLEPELLIPQCQVTRKGHSLPVRKDSNWLAETAYIKPYHETTGNTSEIRSPMRYLLPLKLKTSHRSAKECSMISGKSSLLIFQLWNLMICHHLKTYCLCFWAAHWYSWSLYLCKWLKITGLWVK